MIKVFILVIVILTLGYLFPIIKICGDSMYPTYKDGEILMCYRTFFKKNLKEGDVVIYRSPTDKSHIVVKRIDKIYSKEKDYLLYCLGDNAEVSYDSRYYGSVPSSSLVCKLFSQRRKINNDCY